MDQLSEWKNSSLSTACVIRITNWCNERCEHCAFRSGQKSDNMSVSVAKKINEWMPLDVAKNIMGGELTLLDNYPDLLLALSENTERVRVVTNGQWSRHGNQKKFLDIIRRISSAGTIIDVCVSDDKYHRSGDGKFAKKILQDAKIDMVDTGEITLVPVGRAWDNQLCDGHTIASCKYQCHMTIIENGNLTICPYGYFPFGYFSNTTWDKANSLIMETRLDWLNHGMTCSSCMACQNSSQICGMLHE